MTDWKQIAIELYADGMSKAEIREKLELTATELAHYLMGQPRPASLLSHGYRRSKAKEVGTELLQQGLSAEEVHKRLKRRGLNPALSTVRTWRWHVQGPSKMKIDSEVVREIVQAMPEARNGEIVAMYAMCTGQKPNHQAIGYWVKKLREAA